MRISDWSSDVCSSDLLANQFDDKLAGGATMEQVAQSLNLPLREIPAIDARGRTPEGALVEGLPSIDAFLPVLDRTPPGATTSHTATLDGAYLMLPVDSQSHAAPKPPAAVPDQVLEL